MIQSTLLNDIATANIWFSNATLPSSNYVVTFNGSSPNFYTLSLSSTTGQTLQPGQIINFLSPSAANPAGAGLNIIGAGGATMPSTGAYYIKANGASLSAGQIPANTLVSVVFDGTGFQLLSPGAPAVGSSLITTIGTLTAGTVPAANVGLGALASGITATEQAAADQSSKLATTSYADRAVSNGPLFGSTTGAKVTISPSGNHTFSASIGGLGYYVLCVYFPAVGVMVSSIVIQQNEILSLTALSAGNQMTLTATASPSNAQVGIQIGGTPGYTTPLPITIYLPNPPGSSAATVVLNQIAGF